MRQDRFWATIRPSTGVQGRRAYVVWWFCIDCTAWFTRGCKQSSSLCLRPSVDRSSSGTWARRFVLKRLPEYLRIRTVGVGIALENCRMSSVVGHSQQKSPKTRSMRPSFVPSEWRIRSEFKRTRQCPNPSCGICGLCLLRMAWRGIGLRLKRFGMGIAKNDG